LDGGPAGIGQWAVIAAAASQFNVELNPINLSVGEAAELSSEIARAASGGLVVTVASRALARRDLIISLSARHKLPAIYPYRFFVEAGGLMSYGANLAANYRHAAGYVDRILKGENQPTFRCRRRPNTNWRSTSRPRRHSASPYRPRCLPAPTR